MPDIQTFRAASMQEAMRIMRRELGEDAVVVNTRSIVQRRALPFLKAKCEVEVSARNGSKAKLARSARRGYAAAVAENPSLPRRARVAEDSRVLSPSQLAEHLERELLEPNRFAPNDNGIELSPSLERLIAAPSTKSTGGKPNVVFSDKTNIPALAATSGVGQAR